MNHDSTNTYINGSVEDDNTSSLVDVEVLGIIWDPRVEVVHYSAVVAVVDVSCRYPHHLLASRQVLWYWLLIVL